MQSNNDLFTLEAGRWYAYEMLPGYGERRYYSPIRVESVRPLKTGRNLMRVEFLNACYAEGVQGFGLELRVLHRAKSYLLAYLEYGNDTTLDRSAVITPLSWPWLEAHFGTTVRARMTALGLDHASSIERVVEAIFGQR